MSFLYLQQNYHYSSICDPGMVSQYAKKKLVPQKVAKKFMRLDHAHIFVSLLALRLTACVSKALTALSYEINTSSSDSINLVH